MVIAVYCADTRAAEIGRIIMQYNHIVAGRFLERPNRFVAYVELAGKKEKVHVKNTGRCRLLCRLLN